METLFFTVIALFLLGATVYYFFQKGGRGFSLRGKKEKPEIIEPEPEIYAGGDGAPTLEEALEEIAQPESLVESEQDLDLAANDDWPEQTETKESETPALDDSQSPSEDSAPEADQIEDKETGPDF